MPEVDVNPQVSAEPSAAPVVTFNPADQYTWSPDQRQEWNKTGKIPEPSSQEPAPAAKPEAQAENAAEAGPAKTAQEKPKAEVKPGPKPKLNAQGRIAQLDSTIETILSDDSLSASAKADKIAPLNATIDRIRRDSGIEPRKADAKPAAQPSSAAEGRPKPKLEDKDAEGKPKYASYDDYVEDLSDWKGEQREAKFRAEWQQQEANREAQAKASAEIAKMEKVHPDFREKVKPSQILFTDTAIPLVIKTLLNESEQLANVLYKLGSEPDELDAFVELAKTKPGSAIRKLAQMESEFEGKGEAKPPVEVKPRAPKPPAEVGGRGAVTEDEQVSAAKAGNFRAFEEAENRRRFASR